MHERVLLIEDEPHIVEALSFLLTREGLSVSTHSDGSNAAETAARLTPDLVILDVMLPGKSGFDILSEIRGTEGMAETPVLMLTAKGQSRDRAAAQAAGASMFMTKPFSNREIVANIKALLA
ncbi:response regulator [Neptunicoccus sediminis]|uniref:response regulator n=1 Tax=Neptunicoccus sediminis TaxID=1892596 RepID=UPI000845E155|nr:response regulator [Neptunicoccus sediminis]